MLDGINPGGSDPLRFSILGAGINGLTCAVRLSDAFPNAEIEIISESYSPHTTSDVAAGLWGPYTLGGSSEDDCRQWAQETHDYLLQLWRSGHAEPCGICLLPVVELYEQDEPAPWWHDIVFGFETLNLNPAKTYEIDTKRGQRSYTMAFRYITFTCEPSKIMNYYREMLLGRHVKFTHQRIEDIRSLEDIKMHPNTIIVNCSGLGSVGIFRDTELYPVRGQVQKVKAEAVFHSICTSTCYIIPNTDTIILGGTKQNSPSLSICPSDRYTIRKGCEEILPSLKNARVVRDLVGLRPVRSSGVRLELGDACFLNGKSHTIIHNYGHGGAGITLAWGCAGSVVRIVQETFTAKGDVRSKL